MRRTTAVGMKDMITTSQQQGSRVPMKRPAQLTASGFGPLSTSLTIRMIAGCAAAPVWAGPSQCI